MIFVPSIFCQASISVFAVSGFGIIWYLLNHISISVVLTERERNQHKDELYLADWGERKLNVCQRITIERFSVYFGRSEYYLNNDSSSFHRQLRYDLFLFASSLIYEVNFFSSTFVHSAQDWGGGGRLKALDRNRGAQST